MKTIEEIRKVIEEGKGKLAASLQKEKEDQLVNEREDEYHKRDGHSDHDFVGATARIAAAAPPVAAPVAVVAPAPKVSAPPRRVPAARKPPAAKKVPAPASRTQPSRATRASASSLVPPPALQTPTAPRPQVGTPAPAAPIAPPASVAVPQPAPVVAMQASTFGSLVPPIASKTDQVMAHGFTLAYAAYRVYNYRFTTMARRLRVLPIRRVLVFREDEREDTMATLVAGVVKDYMEGGWVQLVGTIQQQPCKRCAGEKGPFTECIKVDGVNGCGNCKVHKQTCRQT